MNILLIDDHPIVVSAYKNIILESYEQNTQIDIVYNCEQAYNTIISAKNNNKMFDLIITEQNLPSFKEQKLFCGTDIINFVKQFSTKCKFIVITGHMKILFIYDIVRKAKPDGLASKSDITISNLTSIVKCVLKDQPYQSIQIKNCIEEVWKRDIVVDDYNRQILYYLSVGYKIKDLEKVITLTTSAVQKRINKLKKTFNAEDERDLIKILKEKSFL